MCLLKDEDLKGIHPSGGKLSEEDEKLINEALEKTKRFLEEEDRRRNWTKVADKDGPIEAAG